MLRFETLEAPEGIGVSAQLIVSSEFTTETRSLRCKTRRLLVIEPPKCETEGTVYLM